jgi:transcriptional regulator with XRE-family HTH domain
MKTYVINGDLVKQLRTAKGISQTRLGLQAGIDPVWIGRVERGQVRTPQVNFVAKLALGLGVGIDALVSAETETETP